MKKALALLLAILALLPIVACQAPSTQGPSTTVGSETDPAETRDPTAHDIPRTDYKQREFVILSPEPYGAPYFDREEMNEETVNDAIYNRNRQVEDYFNIVIKSKSEGWSDNQATTFQTYAMTGLDKIDLVAVTTYQSGKPMITSGYVLPWNDVKNINLDRDYWNKSVTQTLGVLGNYYYLSGDINYARMLYTSVYYFNKEVAEANHIPDLYEMVREKKWTEEEMINLSKTLTRDNGDGVWDAKDSYGLLQNYYTQEGWLNGANYHTVRFSKDGPQMNYYTEKLQTIVNRLYNMVYVSHDCDIVNTPAHKEIFFDGRALFHCNQLQASSDYRSEDTDFGILPLPMYDEKQKGYTTYSDQWGLVMALPCTATDTARTGAITEVLSALSLKLVRPAYYDKTLLGKVKRDDESEEMLEIVFDGLIYDMGATFISDLSLLPLRSLMDNGNTNLSSWWRSNQNRIERNFKELFDYVKEHNETPA